jgi:3-dehydro-4-phosphotetronate decarboxylase
MSVRCGDVILITGTNSSFGQLRADSIARVDLRGKTLGETVPSKEARFHLAVYESDAAAGAVVHLHSTYATAVSCLRDLNCEDALPVFTPYFAMRLPRLPVVGYYPPGDPALGAEVREKMAGTKAVLLRNHGSITSGKSLFEAAALAEELEEQAKLFFLLKDDGARLTGDQIAELRRRFQ